MTFRLLLFFYNLLGLCLLALFALPALCLARWRKGMKERLGLAIPAEGRVPGRECCWLHGASVGEILAASGLIEGLLENAPHRRLILSTFTLSGRETARERYRRFDDRITFTLLPLDWDGLPGRVLKRCRPDVFIIMETELWPNLLHALGKAACPVVLVNGRLSDGSFPRYLRLRAFFRPLLRVFAEVCVRTSTDAARFEELGAEEGRIRVTGNVKHDRPKEREPSGRAAGWRASVGEGGKGGALVAGSIRSGETKIVLDAFLELRKSFPALLLFLAPRHPERFEPDVFNGSGLSWRRWSEVSPGGPEDGCSVVLVDTYGELADLYGLAAVAFVGGTLERRGGHNLMEPAFKGVPVLFGPHFANFEEEGKALVAAGGGFVTADGAAIVSEASRLLTDRERREEAGRRARAVAEESGGAVEKTLSLIEGVMQRGSS
jgi:3-deoxy-D-manno-octulosonic-acid transferase